MQLSCYIDTVWHLYLIQDTHYRPISINVFSFELTKRSISEIKEEKTINHKFSLNVSLCVFASVDFFFFFFYLRRSQELGYMKSVECMK
jgi:uncharacterized membrane protein